jgi:hypothetical protein
MFLAVALACAAAPLRPCAAQSDPRLVAAVHLAQEGQGDSARAQVKRILDATPVASPLYAEALFTTGVVASSTAEMERQFRRLVVEFNGSAWADDALLRLMQLNFAQGDLAGVTRTAERLAADYPQSEVIPEAATWAARVYFRQQDNPNGCRWLADGLARVDSLNVELKNQLVFLNGRCGVARDTAQGQRGAEAQNPTPTPPSDTAPAPQRSSAWAVQVASSSTQALADDLVTRLARDGFTGARVDREGGAFKVRVGSFAARSDVDAYLARVRTKYPEAFVVEVRP